MFVLCLRVNAIGQTLPSEPVALADGLVTIGGNLSATVGPTDPGYFNYTDYQYSALRMLRIDVTASLHAGAHLSLLGELRSENADAPQAYALHLRVRPMGQAPLRSPGWPHSADLRRVFPAQLRTRQSADWLSARLPVPDVNSARCPPGERG